LIPVPCDAQKPILKTATGDAVYKPEKEAICWSIKSFQGI
jgi:AP-1 complex subunit mu